MYTIMINWFLEFSGTSVLNGKPNTQNNGLLNTGMLLHCITQMNPATLPFLSPIRVPEGSGVTGSSVPTQFTSLSNISVVLLLYVLHWF
jgi:hypothetical protein